MATEMKKLKLKNFQLEQQALNRTRMMETSQREFDQVIVLLTMRIKQKLV